MRDTDNSGETAQEGHIFLVKNRVQNLGTMT